MAIYMPEKVLLATLAGGLQGIQADYSILNDIFDPNVVDLNFVSTVQTYLQNNKVKIAYGYPPEELQGVGWYLLPSNSSNTELFVGNMVNEDAETGLITEYKGEYSMHSTRILTSSPNMDVTLFMDAIARYIILSSIEALDPVGLQELTIQGMDIDPLFQYLPQNLYYKAQVINAKALDTWSTSSSQLIQGITLSLNI